jgi:hypothetical protein
MLLLICNETNPDLLLHKEGLFFKVNTLNSCHCIDRDLLHRSKLLELWGAQASAAPEEKSQFL